MPRRHLVRSRRPSGFGRVRSRGQQRRVTLSALGFLDGAIAGCSAVSGRGAERPDRQALRLHQRSSAHLDEAADPARDFAHATPGPFETPSHGSALTSKEVPNLVRSIFDNAQATGRIRTDIPSKYLSVALLNMTNYALLWFRTNQLPEPTCLNLTILGSKAIDNGFLQP